MAGIFIGLGANDEQQWLDLTRANRHGLIAGATGTGKTVTLQGLAESFSAAGVPVFLADVKGDVSGVAAPGERRRHRLDDGIGHVAHVTLTRGSRNVYTMSVSRLTSTNATAMTRVNPCTTA